MNYHARVTLTLAAWLHDLSPFLWRISGDFGLRWYGLAYVLGFAFAWWWLTRLARRGRLLLAPEAVGDFILAAVVGTLLGGRLGYVIVYQPDLFTEWLPGPPWWGLLAINKGGMASHGGMVGMIIACALFARRHKIPTLHLMDCLAFASPAGVLLGRLANFINGELLGRVVAPPGTTGPWWSVQFPQELLERRTEDQMFELAERLPPGPVIGQSDAAWATDVIAELHAGNEVVAEALRAGLHARHPSQLYQAFAEGVVVALVLLAVWLRPRRPGVVVAWFLMVYGVGRVMTEFWRLPDAQFGDAGRIYGLSRGQWLSTLMIVAGAALLAWVMARSRAERVGGWAGPVLARPAQSHSA